MIAFAVAVTNAALGVARSASMAAPQNQAAHLLLARTSVEHLRYMAAKVLVQTCAHGIVCMSPASWIAELLLSDHDVVA